MKDAGQNPFTFLEVVSATKVPKNTVAIFLLEQVEVGNLNRTGVRNVIPYNYRVIRLPVSAQESVATVVEAVWAVFTTTQSPMTRFDVRTRINNGRKPPFSKNSVDSAITRLTRKGALVKENGTYIKNPDCTERPTTTDEKQID